TRSLLVIARLVPCERHVDAVAMDDRRDGIEEGEPGIAGEVLDCLCEGRGGQRSGCDDDVVPLLGRQAFDLTPHDVDERVALQRIRDRIRKSVTIYRKRAARRDPVAVAHVY